jgi:hypothetical protein
MLAQSTELNRGIKLPTPNPHDPLFFAPSLYQTPFLCILKKTDCIFLTFANEPGEHLSEK